MKQERHRCSVAAKKVLFAHKSSAYNLTLCFNNTVMWGMSKQ